MHAGCRFLGYALDRIPDLGEPARAFLHALLDLRKDRLFLLGGRYFDQVGFTGLDPCTQQDVQGRVSAIVQNHVRALGEHEGPVQIVPMLGQGLPLDREDRCSAFGNCSRRMILRGKDVA